MEDPEFRAQWIKTRRLEIAATLAGWKRDYFAEGIERPMKERAALEAEAAELALEQRVIGDAAVRAKVERRIKQDAQLLPQLISLLKERGLEPLVLEAQQRAFIAANGEQEHTS